MDDIKPKPTEPTSETPTPAASGDETPNQNPTPNPTPNNGSDPIEQPNDQPVADKPSKPAKPVTPETVGAPTPAAARSAQAKSPPMAVIMSVMIAIVLAGLGYAAYRASQNEAANSNPPETTDQTSETAVEPADTEAVDTLNTELDQVEQELDDIEGQLDEDDLSDESLGI